MMKKLISTIRMVVFPTLALCLICALTACGSTVINTLLGYLQEYGTADTDKNNIVYYYKDSLKTDGDTTFYYYIECYEATASLSLMKNASYMVIVDFPDSGGVFDVLFAYKTEFGGKAAVKGDFVYTAGMQLDFITTSGDSTAITQREYGKTAAEMLHVLLQYADDYLLSGSGVTVFDLGFKKY